jgi:hypothetical protein
MDVSRLKNIITAFADRQSDVNIERGKLLVQIHEEVIEAEISQSSGMVYVTENNVREQAELWIIKRLAHLSQLADRILEYVPEEKFFVHPQARFLDDINLDPKESEIECPNALEGTLEELNKKPAGVTKILYVISDAGEGKTTLIHEMARDQAKRYLRKERDWLLLPVSLGGRPFLRLDDVVIGTLANRFRFQFLYYGALLELIKMGVVVLALDGFRHSLNCRTQGVL